MLRKFLPIGVTVLGVAGCGGGDSGGGGTPPKDIIVIAADSNRDGVVTDADLEHPGDQWDKTIGAIFIANLDDDDSDKVRDCDDEKINSDTDLADLATVVVAGWPTVEAVAVGVVKIDAESAESVRVFKKGLDGSTSLVLGSIGPCAAAADCTYKLDHQLTNEEVKAGVTFYIEARRFVGQPLASLEPYDDQTKKMAWTGFVDLTYQVEKPGVGVYSTPEVPDGVDKLKLRVAPWVLLGGLGPHDTLYSSTSSSQLVAGNEIAAEAAGHGYHQIPGSYKTAGGWGDWWTEDIFQTGWTGMPGENGTVRGMRIFNARPWGRAPFSSPTPAQNIEYAPINWIVGNAEAGREPGVLGPDVGGAEFYSLAQKGKGGTQDSHGNHDLIPPHDGYPLGRIYLGHKAYASTREFYNAQSAQGPILETDTTWLAVEHVDEYFHFVPASTPRGWKLLVASPSLMTQKLQELKAQGHGALVLHQGKGAPWEMSIDQALADTELNQWSQLADVKIQGHIEQMKQATGITDAEIIELPTWFEDFGGNVEKVAWNPGTVNMRMMGNVADIAKPWGPLINGKDPFETYHEEELGTPKHQLGSDGQGLKVFFTNNWSYHAAMGEVHCATNQSAPAPFDKNLWWENVK